MEVRVRLHAAGWRLHRRQGKKHYSMTVVDYTGIEAQL
jgi:hypothetical protein